MNLTFNSDTHCYRIDGEVVPAVTAALASTGMIDTFWMTELSRKRGDMVHRGIHCHETGKLHNPYHTDLDALRPYLESWLKLKDAVKLTVLASEFRMASPLYRFAGTMDIVAALGDQVAIIDNKSGIVHDWCAAQTGLYDVLLEEPDLDLTRQQLGDKTEAFLEALKRPHWRFGVELHSDGSIGRLHHFTDYTDRSVGLAAVTLWHWMNRRRR